MDKKLLSTLLIACIVLSAGFAFGNSLTNGLPDSTGLLTGAFNVPVSNGSTTYRATLNQIIGVYNLASVPGNTMLGNNTAFAATPAYLTSPQIKSFLGYYTSGDSPLFGNISSGGGTITGLLGIGNQSLFGYSNPALLRLQVYGDAGTPSTTVPMTRFVVQSLGSTATVEGAYAGYFEARDASTVTISTKPSLIAGYFSVVPILTRNNTPYDDVAGVAIMNTTGTVGAAGTDAIYIAHNGLFGNTDEWYSLATWAASAEKGLVLNGHLNQYGIDMSSANIVSGAAIRIPNNTSLVARDFKNIRDLTLVSLDTTDDVHIGAGASHVDIDTTAVFVQGAKVAGAFQVNTGWFGTNAPVVTPASTYTVGLTDNYIIFNGSGCTVTLPVAGDFTGRVLHFTSKVAATIVSASSNVTPLNSGSPGTAILPNTAGKWAELVSDGANWQIMSGN